MPYTKHSLTEDWSWDPHMLWYMHGSSCFSIYHNIMPMMSFQSLLGQVHVLAKFPIILENLADLVLNLSLCRSTLWSHFDSSSIGLYIFSLDLVMAC